LHEAAALHLAGGRRSRQRLDRDDAPRVLERRLRHLLAGFRASLSTVGHVIDAACIASVPEALTAEVRGLRTGDPDLAARDLPEPWKLTKTLMN
jgi:hypothetical protein